MIFPEIILPGFFLYCIRKAVYDTGLSRIINCFFISRTLYYIRIMPLQVCCRQLQVLLPVRLQYLFHPERLLRGSQHWILSLYHQL